ncbi:MAG: DUF4097 family beta strand repeat protein [Lachnospiraceae bacterium]|nr:DUF4097 family beta strand repeat protein [Lachnospiraceae bacterium]
MSKSSAKRFCWMILILVSLVVCSGCKERVQKITSKLPKLPKGSSTVEEEMELDPFNKITINVLTADFTIRHGSGYQLKVKRSKKYKLDVDVKSHTLTIRDAKVGQDGTASIEVMIPMDAKLKKINASTEVGDVKVQRIKAKKAELYCGVGNCVLKKCNMRRISASGDTGNIRFVSLAGLKDTAFNVSVEEGNVYWKGNARGSSFARKKGKRFITSHLETGDIRIE